MITLKRKSLTVHLEEKALAIDVSDIQKAGRFVAGTDSVQIQARDGSYVEFRPEMVVRNIDNDIDLWLYYGTGTYKNWELRIFND